MALGRSVGWPACGVASAVMLARARPLRAMFMNTKDAPSSRSEMVILMLACSVAEGISLRHRADHPDRAVRRRPVESVSRPYLAGSRLLDLLCLCRLHAAVSGGKFTRSRRSARCLSASPCGLRAAARPAS